MIDCKMKRALLQTPYIQATLQKGATFLYSSNGWGILIYKEKSHCTWDAVNILKYWGIFVFVCHYALCKPLVGVQLHFVLAGILQSPILLFQEKPSESPDAMRGNRMASFFTGHYGAGEET